VPLHDQRWVVASPLKCSRPSTGMGFDFFEGYGLTETAPVLSVTTPKKKPVLGRWASPYPAS